MGLVVGLELDCFGDHTLKQDLECHGMCTMAMCYKKLAVASIFAVIKSDVVIIVISMKSKIKLVEKKTIFLLSIPSGFLSLTNHSVVHLLISFQNREIKKAREDTRAFWLNC
jgi:hypothetical protein